MQNYKKVYAIDRLNDDYVNEINKLIPIKYYPYGVLKDFENSLLILKSWAKEKGISFDNTEDIIPILTNNKVIETKEIQPYTPDQNGKLANYKIELSIGLPKKNLDNIARDLQIASNNKLHPLAAVPLYIKENTEELPKNPLIQDCEVSKLHDQDFYDSIYWPTDRRTELVELLIDEKATALVLEKAKLPDELDTFVNIDNYLRKDTIKQKVSKNLTLPSNFNGDEIQGHALHIAYLINGDGESNVLKENGLDGFSYVSINTFVDLLQNAANNIAHTYENYDVVNISLALGEIPCNEQDQKRVKAFANNDNDRYVKYYNDIANTLSKSFSSWSANIDQDKQPLFVISANQYSNECAKYNTATDDIVGSELMKWSLRDNDIVAIPVVGIGYREGHPQPIGHLGNVQGDILAIGAPGEGILSLDFNSHTGEIGWRTRCGASQSTAIVSRLSALWRKKYKNFSPFIAKSRLIATGNHFESEQNVQSDSNQSHPPRVISTLNSYRFLNSDPSKITVWYGADNSYRKEEFKSIKIFGDYLNPCLNLDNSLYAYDK
jgi:hypothetical protein